mgnify:CR=1 FL=1
MGTLEKIVVLLVRLAIGLVKALGEILVAVLTAPAVPAGGSTYSGTGGNVGRSSSPIRIEVQGANGRWTYAGSAADSGGAIRAGLDRALRIRRDVGKARAMDTRSGAVVDFAHR